MPDAVKKIGYHQLADKRPIFRVGLHGQPAVSVRRDAYFCYAKALGVGGRKELAVKAQAAAEVGYKRAIKDYLESAAGRTASLLNQAISRGGTAVSAREVFDPHKFTVGLKRTARPQLYALVVRGAVTEWELFRPRRRSFLKDVATEAAKLKVRLPESVQYAVEVWIDKMMDQPWWDGLGDATVEKLGLALSDAVNDGLSGQELADRAAAIMGGQWSESQAMRFARSGSTAALNAGAHESRKELLAVGLLGGRQWLGILDNDIRPDHEEANGQKRAGEEPFDVCGEQCLYPGDLGLSPECSINCRCVALGLLPEEMDDAGGDDASDEDKSAKGNPDQPRDPDGRFAGGGSGPDAAPKPPTPKPAESGPRVPASRGAALKTLARVGSLTWDALKKAGAGAAAAEHAAKEWASNGCAAAVAKLPGPLAKVVRGVWAVTKIGTAAAFATYKAGQAAAEAVATAKGHAKGATPEQAKGLRQKLSMIDLATGKAVAMGLEMTGFGHVAFPAAMVPWGSASYLAHATATNPRAVWKAAKGAAQSAYDRVRGRKDAGAGAAAFGPLIERLLALQTQQAGNADLFQATWFASLELTNDFAAALDVAEEVLPKPREGDKSRLGLSYPKPHPGAGAWAKAGDEPSCDPPAFIPLPDVRQRDHFSCGSATSCSVGLLWGVGPDNLDDWKHLLGTDVEESTRPSAIAAAFADLGCQVEVRHGMDRDDLREYWRRGWPVIVCIQDYGPEVPDENSPAVVGSAVNLYLRSAPDRAKAEEVINLVRVELEKQLEKEPAD
jgi:hypothetical protein